MERVSLDERTVAEPFKQFCSFLLIVVKYCPRKSPPLNPPIWRAAANILSRRSRTADKVGPPAWGLGEVLTSPHRISVSCYESFKKKASELD